MLELPRKAGALRAVVAARLRTLVSADDGMSTAEYAVGTLAAAALAAVLYVIVTSDSVSSALSGLIERALTVKT